MADLIEGTDGDVFVSAATCWEIAIKVRSGKWPEAHPLFPDIADNIEAAGFRILPISARVAERAAFLDTPHRDPFDRLLASEAICSELTLLSVDDVFRAIDGLVLG